MNMESLVHKLILQILYAHIMPLKRCTCSGGEVETSRVALAYSTLFLFAYPKQIEVNYNLRENVRKM